MNDASHDSLGMMSSCFVKFGTDEAFGVYKARARDL